MTNKDKKRKFDKEDKFSIMTIILDILLSIIRGLITVIKIYFHNNIRSKALNSLYSVKRF
ncbi:hypothetical protein FNY53_07215 [Staphylococcus equorum]|nr:hypothetical protein FNY53_07215 [Staphylococcus equorum]